MTAFLIGIGIFAAIAAATIGTVAWLEIAANRLERQTDTEADNYWALFPAPEFVDYLDTPIANQLDFEYWEKEWSA